MNIFFRVIELLSHKYVKDWDLQLLTLYGICCVFGRHWVESFLIYLTLHEEAKILEHGALI